MVLIPPLVLESVVVHQLMVESEEVSLDGYLLAWVELAVRHNIVNGSIRLVCALLRVVGKFLGFGGDEFQQFGKGCIVNTPCIPVCRCVLRWSVF